MKSDEELYHSPGQPFAWRRECHDRKQHGKDFRDRGSGNGSDAGASAGLTLRARSFGKSGRGLLIVLFRPSEQLRPRGITVPKGRQIHTAEFFQPASPPSPGQSPRCFDQPSTTLPLIGGRSQGGKIAGSRQMAADCSQDSAFSPVGSALTSRIRPGSPLWRWG